MYRILCYPILYISFTKNPKYKKIDLTKKINLIFFANIKHKGVYRILSVIYLALFIFTFISISNIVSLKIEYGNNNIDVVVKRAHDLKNEFLKGLK